MIKDIRELLEKEMDVNHTAVTIQSNRRYSEIEQEILTSNIFGYVTETRCKGGITTLTVDPTRLNRSKTFEDYVLKGMLLGDTGLKAQVMLSNVVISNESTVTASECITATYHYIDGRPYCVILLEILSEEDGIMFINTGHVHSSLQISHTNHIIDVMSNKMSRYNTLINRYRNI